MRRSEFFASQFQEVKRELTLSAASNPQGASERRNDKTGKRGNSNAVCIDKLTSACRVMGNHGTEIIAICSQLLALYLVAYAGLERWREFSLSRYKKCQEN
jgi:hypothetical protein